MATNGVAEADLRKAQERVLGGTEGVNEVPPTTNIIQGSNNTQPSAESRSPNVVDDLSRTKTRDDPQPAMSIVDQLSRTRTKDEIKSQRERKESVAQTAQTRSNEPPPTTTTTTAVEAPRGRDNAGSTTTSSTPRDADPNKLAPKPARHIERSVSPGQLDDGSHVRCSGERGEAYTPPTGLSKIKGKLHIGGH